MQNTVKVRGKISYILIILIKLFQTLKYFPNKPG